MQKDLFGGAVAAAVLSNTSESKPDFLQRYRLNLRLDQAIIAALLLVVAYVLVFSFGVESGKRYAMAEIKAERAMRERMARELGEKIFANAAQPIEPQNLASAAEVKGVAKSLPLANAKAAPLSEVVKNKKEIPTNEATAILPAGKFAIQTVTFTSKTSAEKYIKKLAAKGYLGVIIPKGKFQQVCVTGFENRQKALHAMGRLKSEGLAPQDAYIRPLA